MVLQEISEDGIRVLTRPLEATFTFTLLTQCPVKKWHFDKSESKSLRKQSWPNFMFLKIRDAISQQKCIFLNILLGLVSKHESEDRNSRSRLGAWDRREEILDLVSKHETEGKKFSISSRSMRLKGRNSRSRLESWKMDLAMLWWECSIFDTEILKYNKFFARTATHQSLDFQNCQETQINEIYFLQKMLDSTLVITRGPLDF